MGMYYSLQVSTVGNKEMQSMLLQVSDLSNIPYTLCFINAVPGGIWKCARMLLDVCPEIQTDYSIIAEAVAPGFDFHDFAWVRGSDMEALDDVTRQLLTPFLHSDHRMSVAAKNLDFDRHYN